MIGYHTWHGVSGQPYLFEVHDTSTIFLPVPGVYVLCRTSPIVLGAHLEPLYVGESESLEDRLNTRRDAHEGFKRALAHGASLICTMRTSQWSTERLRIETDLRHGLNPICNLQSIDVARR